MGSGGTGAGVGSGSGGGAAGIGSGTGGTGVGSGSLSVTAWRALGAGLGFLACSVSGSCVVARSGTLGSTRLLNTPIASLERSDKLDGRVIARLDAALFGLIGWLYW
jgi:hypothetical protein